MLSVLILSHPITSQLALSACSLYLLSGILSSLLSPLCSLLSALYFLLSTLHSLLSTLYSLALYLLFSALFCSHLLSVYSAISYALFCLLIFSLLSALFFSLLSALCYLLLSSALFCNCPFAMCYRPPTKLFALPFHHVLPHTRPSASLFHIPELGHGLGRNS